MKLFLSIAREHTGTKEKIDLARDEIDAKRKRESEC